MKLAFLPFLTVIALAQSPASIHPSKNPQAATTIDFPAGNGAFTATNVPLDLLIATAYAVTVPQVTAEPSLKPLLTQRYDIEVRTDHALKRDAMLELMQHLLADRFKLVVQRETKEVDAYLLTMDKGGTNVRISHTPNPNPEAPLNPLHARGTASGADSFVFRGETMPEFAWHLSELPALDRPVLDRTGLSGSYDFELNLGANPIFTAMPEQLGLKLLAQKVALEVLTVKSVQAPAAN